MIDGMIPGLTIDESANTLYWISKGKSIQFIDLKTHQISTLVLEKESIAITVHSSYLYYASPNELRFADKSNGYNDTIFRQNTRTLL